MGDSIATPNRARGLNSGYLVLLISFPVIFVRLYFDRVNLGEGVSPNLRIQGIFRRSGNSPQSKG